MSQFAISAGLAGTPRRIAVFRPLQLGDLLCAVPALRALRTGFPEARIDLIGLPWAAEFARRFDRFIDGFLAFPGYPGLPEQDPKLDLFPRFVEQALVARYDLAIQLHGNGRITNPLTALLGARQTAAFHRRGDWCPDQRLAVVYPEDRHEIQRLLALVEALGAPYCGEELEFPLTGEDAADLSRALAGQNLAARYAIVHAGSRASERCWPPARFAAVADALADRGITPVLTGTERDAVRVEAVASVMRASPLNLCGRTTLGALAALIDGAQVLVANDTGVSHLAAALRTPSVIVFLASESARWAPLDGSLHRAVEPSLTLGGPHPETVLAEVDSLLQSERALVAG